MKYNVELIIQRLKEFKLIFNEYSNDFDDCINYIENNGYNETTDKILKDFIFNNLFSKLIKFRDRDPIKQDLSDYFSIINNFIRNKKRLLYDNKSKKYKLIPYPDDLLDNEVRNVIHTLCDELVTSMFSIDVPLIELIQSKSKIYEECNNRLKNAVSKVGLKPYCGNLDYMMQRMNFIVECLGKIMDSDRISEAYKQFFKEANNRANLINICTMDKLDEQINYEDKYALVESAYLEILSIEDSLKKYMEPIWKSYLTDPNNYVEGQPYRFLVHCVSAGHVDENKLIKLCTTLVTDKCSPIPSYGNFGYIVDMDIDQIGTMSSEDSGSWVITEDEFINRNFPDSWQLFEKINESSFVFYEYPKTSKLILPWNIENEMTINNIKYRGVTHGKDACYYSEIFFRRTENPIKVSGYFALNENGYEEISNINNQLNERKPIIDFSYYNEDINKYGNVSSVSM